MQKTNAASSFGCGPRARRRATVVVVLALAGCDRDNPLPGPETDAAATVDLSTRFDLAGEGPDLAGDGADLADAADLLAPPDLADPYRGMIRIPAGPFWMGCNEPLDTQCLAEERPYHRVTLPDYAIGLDEVTQSEYADCVAAGSCSKPAANFLPASRGLYPVTDVTWAQAAAYCQWRGGRLPTEAEWEKAARGADGRVFPWGNMVPDCRLSNFHACDGAAPGPVGGRPAGASPYGVLEAADNVSEWVADWFDAGYYRISPASSPPGPAQGTWRVIRGGDFGSFEAQVRVSRRQWTFPDRSTNYIGFRCARSVP